MGAGALEREKGSAGNDGHVAFPARSNFPSSQPPHAAVFFSQGATVGGLCGGESL